MVKKADFERVYLPTEVTYRHYEKRFGICEDPTFIMCINIDENQSPNALILQILNASF